MKTVHVYPDLHEQIKQLSDDIGETIETTTNMLLISVIKHHDIEQFKKYHSEFYIMLKQLNNNDNINQSRKHLMTQ